jgi:hypothetical protein
VERFWNLLALFINAFGWMHWKIKRSAYERRAKKEVAKIVTGETRLRMTRRHIKLTDGGVRVEYLEDGIVIPERTETWTAHEWRERCKAAGVPMTQTYN